eukprot:PLAT14601.1.p1 GENE.PLAT14601.1~~PLAT14601.1.p1  ORF type:complete len:329 (+),score=110.58 PLAT14601.1:83-988(+)
MNNSSNRLLLLIALLGLAGGAAAGFPLFRPRPAIAIVEPRPSARLLRCDGTCDATPAYVDLAIHLRGGHQLCIWLSPHGRPRCSRLSAAGGAVVKRLRLPFHSAGRHSITVGLLDASGRRLLASDEANFLVLDGAVQADSSAPQPPAAAERTEVKPARQQAGRAAEEAAPSAPFHASYDWQPVLPGQSVPPGLEVQLPLDGSGAKRARIPATWQLQLWMGDKLGYLRLFVKRSDKLLRVRRAIAARAQLPMSCVTLIQSDDANAPARLLRDDETVEEARLFHTARRVAVSLDERCKQPPAS